MGRFAYVTGRWTSADSAFHLLWILLKKSIFVSSQFIRITILPLSSNQIPSLGEIHLQRGGVFILSCGYLQRCHLKCADWLCNLHYRIYRTISYTFIFQIYIQAIFSFLSNINANINKEIGSDNVERRHYNQSLFRFLSTTISAESLLSPRSEPRYIITGKWILSRR